MSGCELVISLWSRLQKCRIYLCGTKKDLVSGDQRVQREVDYHMTTDFADGTKKVYYDLD